MKRRRGTYLILGAGMLLAACAHTPREPALDRSSGLDLAALAARFSTPNCVVSVPLTQAQAMALAESEGVPHPENRTDWLRLVAAVQSGDQLREVSCLTRGNAGRLAGAVFYGLFRRQPGRGNAPYDYQLSRPGEA
ncbi:MAG: hypothetical protein EOP50_02440 [Sphingobacteriales bacterium]|nr:MAG: hypothetical protein EOP50_02440 [Sphingobacteriales bacterium]